MNGGLSQFARVLASVDPTLLRASTPFPVPTPTAGLEIPPVRPTGTARQVSPETHSLPRHPYSQETQI